jgi:hypothetical protein
LFSIRKFLVVKKDNKEVTLEEKETKWKNI